MFESKYSKVLTVILVIVIIAIIGLLGFLAFEYYKNYVLSKDAAEMVENFTGEVSGGEENNNNTGDVNQNNTENPFDQIQSEQSQTAGSGNKKPMYKGFGMLGTMEIPATNFKYPVLEKVTRKSIETAVAFQWGAGLNQPGNTVIIGHNYRNGMFFSNNKKLKNGDKIYITDNSGKKLTYTIYDKFETTESDTDFYQRDTGGKPEVSLSTCTDNSKARLIILARAE